MKIKQSELDKRESEGARVVRKGGRKRAAKKEPAAASQPAVQVTTDTSGMAAMAASLEAMSKRQTQIQERLAEELATFNARTKATITVTSRNQQGGIETADVEIVQ